MGQKINPRGFRVGISQDWDSRWFAGKKDYSRFVLEDYRLRHYLREQLSNVGLIRIEIERSIAQVTVIIHVTRPGMVIGRGGSGVERLKSGLKKITSAKIDLNIEEYKNPETSARFVASEIARRIERRIHFRRAMYRAVETTMERGALGIKITCAGVLSGASSISRSETVIRGKVPAQTLRADIDFAGEVAKTTYGTIGVKVLIYRGEKAID